MPGEIRVDEKSVVARYADWHAHLTRRPVAALGPPTAAATLFVENEIVVDADDEALIEELRERHGAELIPEAPLPERPELLRRNREIDLSAMPGYARLRFDRPPELEDRPALLAHALEQHGGDVADAVVSSEVGASLAALVVRHTLDGAELGLDVFGRPFSMPLAAAQEGPVPVVGSDPFTWPAFGGSTRMVEAWQMVDSVKRIRGDHLVTIGILDAGFWVDAKGVPLVPLGQSASDFDQFMQLNLQDESRPVGGMNLKGSPWHGNAVASAAAATVGNSQGAAGSGGTVATPMFFQTDYSITQILRSVKICAAWGIDVLNFSFGTWGHSETFFSNGIWDRNFQFAFDNGVVMVAGAGNYAEKLPDDMNIRPATRTPGVLAVGWLDPDDTPNDRSNYGSSVWLWAPGTNIPVAPFGGRLTGWFDSGTSMSAPIVAGVAAMMRYVNDGMSAADIRTALVQTGRPGTGRVSKMLDAFAAVWYAAQGVLPDPHEPNNTPATARELLPNGPAGTLMPFNNGFSIRSSQNDPDYWKFTVDRLSAVTVTLEWYERLGSLILAVEAEDPSGSGTDQTTSTADPASGRHVVAGLLAPGRYRVLIRGTGVTAYRLRVTRTPARLETDIFEENDSFERAPTLLFESAAWTRPAQRHFGPGSYDATLHQESGVSIDGEPRLLMNDDYFRLVVPRSAQVARPTVSVYDADIAVEVTLYDSAHERIDTWNGQNVTVYPPTGGICFLKVSATGRTRYRIHARMTVDPHLLPDLVEQVGHLPKWWGDPPELRLKDPTTHYFVGVDDAPNDDHVLAFDRPDEPLLLELLNAAGEVVREASAEDSRLFVDVGGLESGSYLLRVTREAGSSTAPVGLRPTSPLR